MTDKRFLAAVLCLFITLSGIPIMAAEENKPSEVLYQNDFEEEINAASNRLGKDGVSKVDLYNYGGEYGQVIRFAGAKENTQTDYRQIRFDFSKTMTAGDTFVISYDFMNGQNGNYPFYLYTSKGSTGSVTTANDQYVTVANSNISAAYGIYGYYKTTNAAAPSAWTPVKLTELTENDWMHMDVVVKMTSDGREYTFFVDGEKKGSWTNTYIADVPGIMLSNTIYASTESVYYVDNLIIKQIFDPHADVAVSGGQGGDTVTVTLSDTFTNDILSGVSVDKVVIKDEKGSAIRIRSADVSDGKLVIKTAAPFEYDTGYELAFDGVADCYGRALPPVSFSSLSEVDESGNIVLRVKATSAIRYDGTSVPIEDTMPADIKEFVFTLNSRISKYEGGITLNGVPLALAYDDLEKTVTASADGLLEGSTAYTLEVNDNIKNSADVSIKPYENSFTTEEGKFEIRDFKWCDGEGNEILPDEVSMGATYYLTVDAVNTTSSPKTVVLTYAAVSGERKSGFNYKEISIPKADYINESISYQAQAADEKVSGFVTDSFSSLRLLDKPAYLINNDITESASDIRCTVSQDGYGDVENAAVQVYEPGRDAATISSNPPIYQDVIAPKDGKLEFSFAVSSGRSGAYNVYISDPDGGTAKYLTYNYVNPEANAAALKWLNSLSAVPTAEEFESKSDDLGFHCDLYESNKAEFLKLVYEDSLAKAFEGANISSAAAALYKLAIQAALNNGNHVDIFKYSSDIDLAGSRLGRFMDKDFVTEILMSDVNRRMLEYASTAGEEGASNAEIFDSNLIRAFVLATVNYSDGYGNIREVVSEFKTEAGISSSDITTAALQEVDGKNYNTYAALAETMKNANTSKNVSAGSGGSGSSSSRGSGSSNGSGGVSNVTIDTSVYGGQEAVITPSDPYNDIASVPWARDAIISLTNKGIISGNGNGEFLPDNAVKREEFTKMAVIAFANTDTVQINTFEDVSGDEWYAQYINAAAALGIVNGQSENLFGVGQTITRQDMAVIVYKAAAYSGIELDRLEAYSEFTDDADISEYAVEAVYKLMAAGIINGVGDGRFAPLDSATRAEAAKLVYSLLMYTK